MPPYSVVEGEVDEKGIEPGGKPYVLVSSETVEVDTSSLDGSKWGTGSRYDKREATGQ